MATNGRTLPDDTRAGAENLLIASFIGDLLFIVGGLFLGYWIRFAVFGNIGVEKASLTFDHYLGHFGLGALFMIAILFNFRLYTVPCLLSSRRAIRHVVKAAVLWSLGYLAMSLILKFNPPISRIYCFVAGSCMIGTLLAWRFFFRQYLRSERVSRHLRRRVVIVGWSAECDRLAEMMNGPEPSHLMEIVGAVPSPTGWGGGSPPESVPCLGLYDEFRDILYGYDIDTVLVANMEGSKNSLMHLANTCEKEMVEFKIIPSGFQILLSGLHLEEVNRVPVLGVSKLPLHSALNVYTKRIVDILGGIIGMILSVPIIAVCGALVYLESPGPIFYRQRRLGRNGKLFDILKIRSMKMNSEPDMQPGWTVKDDPRCLKIGKFLRKWNLDEVPQFWNVVCGEMSLVGPRPERPELILDFKEEIPHYNARHNIKPGITGWAQVNGFRGDTDLEERIKCDLYYLENWNLFMDFQIMVMTFLRRENAC